MFSFVIGNLLHMKSTILFEMYSAYEIFYMAILHACYIGLNLLLFYLLTIVIFTDNTIFYRCIYYHLQYIIYNWFHIRLC